MNESRAVRYQRLRRRAGAVNALAGAAVLAVAALTPLGARLAAWAARAADGAPPWLAASCEVAVFVAALAALLEIVSLPVVLYLGARLDRRFKRADHSAAGLAVAQVQTAAFAVGVAVLAGLTVHLAVRVAGGWWWLVTGLAMSIALAAAVRGVSGLIARAGARDMAAHPTLAARLSELSVTAGVPVRGIYEWASHAGHTASVAGFGRGRRVLISPDMARDWQDDEIAVVVAHELSHHKHHDLVQMLALDAVLLSAALAVADLAVGEGGAGALVALPRIALTAGSVWTLLTPARHALSRWHERRADQFALALTGHADAFAAAIRRLAEQHLAEERPSTLTRWFTHRHPPIEERLAMAGRR